MLVYTASKKQFTEDVFDIKGRGTVVTGRALAPIAVGQQVTVQRTDGTRHSSTVTGVEAFNKTLQTASAGDNVGILLSDIDRGQVGRGDRVVAA